MLNPPKDIKNVDIRSFVSSAILRLVILLSPVVISKIPDKTLEIKGFKLSFKVTIFVIIKKQVMIPNILKYLKIF